MQQALGLLFRIMPFLFGLGFIAPLISQVMPLIGVTAPGGVSPVVIGLLFGGLWGAYATWRGRWL